LQTRIETKGLLIDLSVIQMACPKCGYAKASSYQDCTQCAKSSYDVDDNASTDELADMLAQMEPPPPPSAPSLNDWVAFDLGGVLLTCVLLVLLANVFLVPMLFLSASPIGSLIYCGPPALLRIFGALLLLHRQRHGFYVLLAAAIYGFLVSRYSAMADIVNFASLVFITIPVILYWERLD